MSLKLSKTIVMVGLMGAGKTAIGKRLAEHLGVPFVDIDQKIEESEGCSVAELFETKGEPYFRKKEREVIAKDLEDSPHVMATGGGAFMNKKTRELILDTALSVWLRADIEILLERVSRKHTRPLLEQGDKRAILEKLMEERYPVYAEADIVVETDEGPHQKVIDKIIWKM